MTRYDHIAIEKKWQHIWAEKQLFRAQDNSSKPKYYVLDMWPYPSGAGLHVGHVVGYTATDIIARYKRMQGFNVLHPIGWDSFGLPAEQYALRTGTHPAITTQANVDNFRRQLQALGFSYDWNREVASSDPDYYKWTQWIFTKLFERGLAYEAEISVNFCPALGTVLANEEVDDGKSKEGGHPVIKKPLRQWVLKITAYADRLIDDLALVDWPESVKAHQINWIGKSVGAEIHFPLEHRKETLTVFTTRQDTLFGCTFIVLAPEHPLVHAITTQECREKVDAYRQFASQESEISRTATTKEKTGVFTGAFGLHPITGEKLPIWIADYVLPHYGHGAVMGVPGSCERDFEFATKYSLPIVQVVVPPDDASDDEKNMKKAWEGDGRLINSSAPGISLDGLNVAEGLQKMVTYLEEKKIGSGKVQYKLRDWLFSRQRYWGEPIPILHFADGSMRSLELDELPLLLPPLSDFKPSENGQSPLSKIHDWVEVVDPKTGKKARRETNTMPQWAGSSWYYLRFCDPHNDQNAWDKQIEKYWMPVDLYLGGVEHAVLHLLYARFWHKVLYDCGLVTTLEPFQKLRNQGLVVAKSYKNKNNAYVAPEEVREEKGKYFHTKTGEELACQIEKMSKSKLNGITPDDIIHEYGADTLRLYEMFMGPLEKEKIWATEAMLGCRRFLARSFDLVTSEKVTAHESEEAKRLIHKLIARLTPDMEALSFNTVIAKCMEFVNDFEALPAYPQSALSDFTKLLAPAAPHIAEEMWQILGHTEPLLYAPYPKADPHYAEDAVITYVIQVNGKVRGRLDLPKDEGQDVVVDIATKHANVQKFLEGSEVKKVIFVPNKLLNFVVAPCK
jgi:leucyl-tRNA synthetase